MAVLHAVVKMENTRQAMKDLYGVEYPDRVQPFKVVIRGEMEKTGHGEIDTMIDICNPKDGSVRPPMAVALFIAAAMDVLEENTAQERPEGGS